MLRRFLDFQLSLTEKGKPLHKLRPLVSAGDTFLYEPPLNTSKAPHIRDAVDLKRWMMIVIFALVPCIFMAIWNTGVQKFVYTSGSLPLMQEYYASSHSLSEYFDFVLKDSRYLQILMYGALTYIPIMIISYLVGGLVEGIFACVRGHEIAEGFLVTGMLYALILPPTIPYWMVAFGVAVGIIFSKELFGGTGMNIMNPALTCRAFLFFTFPGQMSGDVWAGTNPTVVRESLNAINKAGGLSPVDGYTQATALAKYNIGIFEVKRSHVDAIAANLSDVKDHVTSNQYVQKQFSLWSSKISENASFGNLMPEQLKDFVTSSVGQGGLGLSPDSYEGAFHFAGLQYGSGIQTDWNFFLGNKLGSLGETSILACLIGAVILIYTRIGSWRTMVAVLLGAYLTALILQLCAIFTGPDNGILNPAIFAFPAYKHLLIGGLAFGAVFMATDPVSSSALKLSKWIYGFFIGAIVILIRAINPAYPEGVMLAILTGNVFAPLIDHYVALRERRKFNVVE